MALRKQVGKFDPNVICRKNDVYIANASYDTLYMLLCYVINDKLHAIYKKLQKDIRESLIEVVAHMKEICKLLISINDRFGEYKDSQIHEVLKAKSDHPMPFVLTRWKYKYDFHIAIQINRYGAVPAIDIILSTVCFRLIKNKTLITKFDAPTKKAMTIFDKAVQTFETVLKKLQQFHCHNYTDVAKYISPKYRIYQDIFIEINETKRDTGKGYFYNDIRRIHDNSAQSWDLYQPGFWPNDVPMTHRIIIKPFEVPFEIELDLNVPITEIPDKKYDVGVGKINNGNLEVCELQLSRLEINNMIDRNIPPVIILVIADNKLIERYVMVDKDVYNDIKNEKCGLLCVGYTKLSETNIIFEKRLIDKYSYDLIQQQGNNFTVFGMMATDYMTVDNGIVELHKILIDKTTFRSIKKNELFYKFAPMVTSIGGNKFKIVDILAHSTTLANIMYDKYKTVCMKPIISVISAGVYYEYALVKFPIDMHLVNVNIYDPKTLICTNVVLDENTYFKLPPTF
uniref:Uncharacterized protein n=1 Tax=viral metagenome TaxID=1070528 RepID=A0A6C0C831_9ZZZZ